MNEFGRRPEWLTVVAVRDMDAVYTVRAQLDAGEAEAIVLALENEGSTLLIDERRGRRYAIQLGLSVVGTFGILIQAKRRGIIRVVRPILDALIGAGFRTSDALYKRTLAAAGEWPEGDDF